LQNIPKIPCTPRPRSGQKVQDIFIMFRTMAYPPRAAKIGPGRGNLEASGGGGQNKLGADIWFRMQPFYPSHEKIIRQKIMRLICGIC
jgi:hypothetical protein